MNKYFFGWNGIRGTYIRPMVFIVLFIIIVPIVYVLYFHFTFVPSTDYLSEQQKIFVRLTSKDQHEDLLNESNRDHYINVVLIASIIPLLILGVLTYNKNKIMASFLSKSFYCNNCCKSIVPANIQSFTCPNCHAEKRNGVDLIYSCRNCKDIIHKFPCPYCRNEISLIKKYDKKSILKTRHEK